MKIGIIGSGNLGTALAKILSEKHEIILYDINTDIINEINTKHTNSKYLKGIKLDKKIIATKEISELKKTNIIIFSVPSKVLKNVCIDFKPYYTGQEIISTIKGLSKDGKVMTKIIEENLKCNPKKVLALSGPAIAKELAEEMPTIIMLAGDKENITIAKKTLETKELIIRITTDKKGIQLLGFYKNIIAIIAGLCEGLELGHNFEASLITKAYEEFYHMTHKKHIHIHTFVSPAGLGDLYVTAMSPNSRNRTFGYLIGKGMNIEDVKKKIGQTIEGYENLLTLKGLKDKAYIDSKLIAILIQIIQEKNTQVQIKELLIKYLNNDNKK